MDIERFIRPSALERLSLCAGSATLQAAVFAQDGEAPSSPEAAIGTLVHKYVADGIVHWKLCQETGERGAEWGDAIALACEEAAAAGIDSWSVYCIRLTMEFYRDLIAKYEIDTDNVLPEHELDMGAFGFMRKGTADLVLVQPFERVVIVDIKAGYLDQGDAEDHDQMAAYACAAAATFKAEAVHVFLWQPRAEKAHRVSAADFDAAALLSTAEWSRNVTNAARNPNAELSASYQACVYCKALLRCPAAKEYIMRAQQALEMIGPPSTPDAWGDLAGAAKLGAKWAEDAKDQVKSHLVTGGAATGFKLGTPRAMRIVTQVPAAIQKLEAAGYGQTAAEALSMSFSKLPDFAQAVIQDLVTEKLSEAPLVADRRGAKGAS